MNINTLTIKAQEALQAALALARERGQQAVEPLHLLSVLVREDDSLGAFLLGRVGVNVRGLREEAARAVASLPRVEGGGCLLYTSRRSASEVAPPKRMAEASPAFSYSSREWIIVVISCARRFCNTRRCGAASCSAMSAPIVSRSSSVKILM